MLNQELIREEYGFLDGEIFLNVSQVCMPPKRVQQAYGSFMDNYVKCFGEGVVDTAWRIVHGCRPKLAQMIHAAHNHEIGFVKNTAEGMGILASGYPLKPGDNVVIADQEHQSTLFPWINAHQTRGIALNIVHHENNEISTEKMIGAIDEHTKVLIVSSAQFSTGFMADLKALGEACRARGVVFAVDGIQTLGRIEMNVQEMCIDYLVAGSNKGLLGSLGCGFIYCSDRIVGQIIPPYAGYQSTVSHVSPPSVTSNFESLEWYPHARRFESGNLSYNCILAVDKGVELLLELGVPNIEAHVLGLERYLRKKIADLPLQVVQPRDEKHWSGIVCIYYPKEHEQEVIEILKSKHIHCTMRGGYIRLGIDFYNTYEQMDTVSDALHSVGALAK